MDNPIPIVLQAAALGAGATALMDLGGVAVRALGGPPPPDYALVGRWVGHMPRRWRHESIARAPAARGERVLGWVVHYAVGIAFAGLLLAIAGAGWLRQPTPGPALLVGLGSVAAPFLLMQPAMGSGLAARRAPDPWAARRRSLLNHLLFALGLYGGGLALARLAGA